VKLARVVGPPVPPRPTLPAPTKRGPGRLVVHARVAAQVAELGLRDSEVRQGEPEGVHKARVACRRLRSALATYRPLLDRDVTEPIRAELRWVAHALGDARDLDVAHQRLRGLVDDLPRGLVVGPVRRRIDRGYAPPRLEAHARAREALASERYFALREELDRLAAAPPWSDRAEVEARDVLPPRVRKDLKRLRQRVRRAERVEEPAERAEAIHAARRAAKRLRYAAETLGPVWGKDASRVAKAAKRMASTLGVRQDAVVTMPQLFDLAEQAHAAGESAFTYGLLHAEEQRVADEVDEGFARLFKEVERALQRSNL
jgi:CHAD domain-containing protein